MQQAKNGAFFQILRFSSFLLMCKYRCNNENLTEKSSMIGSENFRDISAEECSRYCFSIKIFSKGKTYIKIESHTKFVQYLFLLKMYKFIAFVLIQKKNYHVVLRVTSSGWKEHFPLAAYNRLKKERMQALVQ